jgi:NAD(P)-dependent dehydrogenase (short-subunit alcohol dehydrogenase family)
MSEREGAMTLGAVVITGASSGIGAAIARDLVGRGYMVFGTVRRGEDEPPLERAGITPLQLDVTEPASVARARDAVVRRLAGRPLAGLVNNAGIPAAGPVELVPLDALRHVLEVNVIGAVAVTQAFLPLLRAAHGRVVNVGSIASRMPLPFMGPYAASKAALDAISQSLRRELLPHGVAVVVVQPGSYQSRIWEKVEAMDPSPYRESVYAGALLRFRDLALASGRAAPPPDRVAGAVRRALTMRHPPARMLVVESRLGQYIGELLPERWLDRLIARQLSPR